MVLTETINYHANHIGAIRTNKDFLSQNHNVSIVITRKRWGEYQEVDITGFQKDIRNVKKDLIFVVEQAESDYQEYLERKRKRARHKGQNSHQVKLPVVDEKKTKPKNMFALLNDVEDEGSYQEDFPDIGYDPTKSWGDQ
jgi:hypothetical protein